MKLKIFLALVMIWCLISCNQNRTEDLSEVEQLMYITDSLTTQVQQEYDQAMKNFYLLTEDSVKVDSLTRRLNLNDSVGFYQHLENSTNRFEDFIVETKREINFTRNQLISVKTEYLENNISEAEFKEEIEEINRIISFLKERVDTNLLRTDKRHRVLFEAFNDTIQQ